MRTKKTRLLLYLGIAILIAAATYIAERPDQPRVSDASARYLIPDYDRELVARVEIEQLLDGAELKREGDAWQVAARATPDAAWRPADRTRVMSALGGFGGLEEGLSVSNNPDNRALYQVDQTGVAVRGFDAAGRKIFDVIIGKNGPNPMGTYVRRADEDRVWLVDRPLVGAFSPVAEDWVAKEPSPTPEPSKP